MLYELCGPLFKFVIGFACAKKKSEIFAFIRKRGFILTYFVYVRRRLTEMTIVVMLLCMFTIFMGDFCRHTLRYVIS